MKDQKFRANSFDAIIHNMITRFNEYRLPERFDPQDLVLDIGSHAGYFAEAVLEKGAKKVFCFESNEENYKLSTHNLQQRLLAGKAELNHCAVWRSDDNDDLLFHNDYTYMNWSNGRAVANTGNSFVSPQTGDSKVNKTSLDEQILRITEGGKKRIRLLKIDCEGSEFPILLTASKLHYVDEICGEYHEPAHELSFPDFLNIGVNYTKDLLQQHLEKNGFAVNLDIVDGHAEEKWKGMGMFFAKRRKPPLQKSKIPSRKILAT